MNVSDRINELCNILTQANNDYYNKVPTISDTEYDALKDELRDIDPDNKVLLYVGAAPISKRRTLPVPMASQDKVNTIADAERWAKSKGATHLCIQEKLDGMSVLVEYLDGEAIAGYSRGDGLIGEDITDNLFKVEGFQKQIPGFTGCLRGEVLLRKSVWREHFKTQYVNTRNATAGIIRREGGDEQKRLTAYFYDVIGRDFDTEIAKLDWLLSQKLFTPSHYDVVYSCINTVPHFAADKYRENLDYDIDGLVLKINDIKQQTALGRHGDKPNGNPRGQIALKFAPETRGTVLLDIEWDIGLVGRITPVAILEPVYVAGVTISRASLYNCGYIKTLGLTKGARVLVSRRNDVIPRVEEALNNTGVSFDTPTTCPSCDSPVVMDGEYLVCENPGCRVVGGLMKWVNNFQIMNLGQQTIKQLVAAKMLYTPADLYMLNRDSVVELLGEKIGSKVLAEIDKTRSGTLANMLGSLNIPMCGRRLFQSIVDAGYTDLDSILSISRVELCYIPGIGGERADQIIKGLQDKESEIKGLLQAGWKIKDESVVRDGIFSEQSFCFTGVMTRPRKVLEKAVLENGGTISSVSRELTYLVAASDDGSSKYIKAKKLGLNIISEEDFWKMLPGTDGVGDDE